MVQGPPRVESVGSILAMFTLSEIYFKSLDTFRPSYILIQACRRSIMSKMDTSVT